MAHPDGPAAGVRVHARGVGSGGRRHPARRARAEPSRARPALAIARMIRPDRCRTGRSSPSTATTSRARRPSMEALAFAGLDTVLFLAPPTPERLAAFAGFRGIGIAGVARSRDPAWMDRHLPPVFRAAAVARRRRSSTTRSARPSTPPRMSAPSAARSTSRRSCSRAGCRSWSANPGWAASSASATSSRSPRARATASTGTRPCRGIRSRRWTRPTSAAIWRGKPTSRSASSTSWR